MQIIKKTIVKIIKWATQNVNNSVPSPEGEQPKMAYGTTIGSGRYNPDNNGMNFTVFSAVGGKVIQFNQYNPNTDRTYQQLYIVTDKDNLGEELGMIITKESLTR